MKYTSNVIIIGTSHHNTLSMVRSFGEEGQKVILFIYGTQDSYVAKSIYVESVMYFEKASDAIDSFASQMHNFSKKPLVIACSDEVSSIMDMRYDEFIGQCVFFNAGSSGRITEFMDKQKQLNLAKICGFSAPSSIDSLPNDIDVEAVKYPCFVKPKASIYGGKNITICQSKEELLTALKNYYPKYNVLVQDYIQKEYEIVVLGLSAGDKIVIPGFIQKHREERGGTTYSTVRPISELSSYVVAACRQLIAKVGYTGLWGIECIKQGNDYYFLELNMRNDATTYALKVAGVNLPNLYRHIVESTDYILPVYPIRKIQAIVEFNDFNFVLKGKIGLFQWIREYRGAACKYFHVHDDLMPYKLKQSEYIKFLRKRILKF